MNTQSAIKDNTSGFDLDAATEGSNSFPGFIIPATGLIELQIFYTLTAGTAEDVAFYLEQSFNSDRWDEVESSRVYPEITTNSSYSFSIKSKPGLKMRFAYETGGTAAGTITNVKQYI
jgi:hypothetical protein